MLGGILHNLAARGHLARGSRSLLHEIRYLGAVSRIELSQDPTYKHLDRALADVEIVGDELVGLSLTQTRKYVLFSRGQAVQQRSLYVVFR